LFGRLVGENLLERQVELAEVVLSKPVLVPAAYVEEEAFDAVDGQAALFVPFGVQRLRDRVSNMFGVTKGEHEERV